MADWSTFIQTGSFRGVAFDFVSTQDEFAKVYDRQQIPYRDGVQLEDRANEGRTFDIMAVFVEDDYPDVMNQLIDAINANGPGEFVHPIHGKFKALVTRAQLSHDANDSNDSATMQLHVEEHTDIAKGPQPTRTSISARASAVRGKVMSVLNTVTLLAAAVDALPNVSASARAGIASATNDATSAAAAAGAVADSLEADGDVLSAIEVQAQVNAVLATANSVVSTLGSMRIDANTTAPPEQYDLVAAMTGTASALADLANAVVATKPQLITFVVDADISVLTLAHERYGDSTRAVELLTLNPWISDPLLVPAGSQVTAYAT